MCSIWRDVMCVCVSVCDLIYRQPSRVGTRARGYMVVVFCCYYNGIRKTAPAGGAARLRNRSAFSLVRQTSFYVMDQLRLFAYPRSKLCEEDLAMGSSYMARWLWSLGVSHHHLVSHDPGCADGSSLCTFTIVPTDDLVERSVCVLN